jgi:hypothetical protein
MSDIFYISRQKSLVSKQQRQKHKRNKYNVIFYFLRFKCISLLPLSFHFRYLPLQELAPPSLLHLMHVFLYRLA